MNKLKKTTLIDRIRSAWRAFCNKPATTLSLGLDIKRCSECERCIDDRAMCVFEDLEGLFGSDGFNYFIAMNTYELLKTEYMPLSERLRREQDKKN